MFHQLKMDMQDILTKDPAIHTPLEALLCYPGFTALRRHRRAHRAYLKGHHLYARMISHRTYRKTGIDIHPGAQIGRHVLLDHGCGIVIGETAVVGDHVTIYQGVTLGGTGKERGKRHPTIGNHVLIGAGAKILGAITVGDYAKIGAGAIVLEDIPACCTVVGNPGRMIKH